MKKNNPIKNKFTIIKTPFSFKFIPFYFFIIIFFTCFFLNKIDIDIFVKNIALVKIDYNNEKEDIIFSDYNGLVYDVLKKEGDIVKKGEPLFTIITKKNINNEKKIIELEKKINEGNLSISNQYEALKNISNYKTIFSPINSTIGTIYVQNGNKIRKNKKMLKYINEANHIYYIESLFDTSKISNIKKDEIAYIKTKNKNIIIGKIRSVYPHKNTKSKHYVRIELLETNQEIKENELVTIKIITKSEKFIHWFFRDLF
jgi:biotin carboxyl carrier protein